MKTNAKKLGIALITLSAALFGCKKDDPTPVYTTQYKTAVTNDDLSNGPWKVQPSHASKTNTKKQIDKTHPIDFNNDLAGWDFKFLNNGAVVASKNGKTVEGKWKTEEQKMKQIITFDFAPEIPFNQLNNDWLVVKNGKTLQLYPVESNPGWVTPLTLER